MPSRCSGRRGGSRRARRSRSPSARSSTRGGSGWRWWRESRDPRNTQGRSLWNEPEVTAEGGWTLANKIQVATAVVQLVTFVAVLVYTFETRKLRKHAEQELGVLRDQART